MPDASTPTARIVALVRDLLLTSRITATSRPLGVPVRVIRDAASLDPQSDGTLLLADLNLPGAIEAASGWLRARADRRVVGFVSHVDSATIVRARDAGITEVVARGRFFETLPALLESLAT